MSGAFDVVNPAKPHPFPVTLITENLRLLPIFPFIINTILFSKTRVSNPSKVSSPTGSGVPILLPAILVPDQPRSIGLIFITLNPPMESRNPLPLPRFFPALLTAVTPLHKSEAGTEKNYTTRNSFYDNLVKLLVLESSLRRLRCLSSPAWLKRLGIQQVVELDV
uniref:Uncharacterized protein n=1 Tax=Glossina palpalis gambiensis TaxID=67801 RepID=A0A1B0BJD7_9MUSC